MSWAMYNLWKFCAHLMWYMLNTWFCWNPVFHFLVLCSSQSGDHPEKNLANFHYTPYMKWFKKKGSFYVFGSLLEIWKKLHQNQLKLKELKCHLLWHDNSRRENSHQWIWAICSINSLVWDEIVFFKSQLGRNLLLEESLARPIHYKVSERPSSYISPLEGSWFSERKCQLISH
jgi:hypothetical protein